MNDHLLPEPINWPLSLAAAAIGIALLVYAWWKDVR